MQSFAKFFVFFFFCFFILVSSDKAFACLESRPFSARLLEANIIFEGRLISYELHKIDSPEQDDPNIVTAVYVVDKNWKGAKAGQRVTVYKPQFTSIGPYKLDKAPKSPEVPYKGIILLSGKKVLTTPSAEYPIYRGEMCPEELWDISFKGRLAIVLALFISVFR